MTAPVFIGEQVGCLAHAALSGVGIGRVAAVFSRSFYIVTGAGGWACIGSRALEPGPLNLRCGNYQQSLASQLQTASLVRLGVGSFTVEGAGRFLFHQARRWVPPAPPPWTNDSVRRGLRALDDVANPPAEGFGRLMLEGSGSSVNQNDPIGLRAFESGVALDRIILGLFRQEELCGVEVLDRLIGLGPGLTPSGDDYLAGMLVALGVLRETSARDALWQVICRRMATLTSEISCAHLRAAATGALSNSVHLLFNSILAGASEQLPVRLAAIGAIGHTSGWDASAGAVRVLRLWLDSDGYVP